MKVGDLVRSSDEEDDCTGVVVEVTPTGACDRVDVYWGPDSPFGRSVEWDWDYDLEVVEESGGLNV